MHAIKTTRSNSFLLRALAGSATLFALHCSSTPAGSTSGAPAEVDASATPDGSTVVEDSGATDAGMVDASRDAGSMCRAAREQLLRPIDKVSTGDVSEISSAGGVVTLYVDAAAGGAPAASMNPRVYLNLGTRKRVDITDTASEASTAWDLALKRAVLFTNSGDGGAGAGGSLFVAGKDLENVTMADVTGKTLASESFFDAACNPKLDQTNAVKTSFDGWYQYNGATNTLTPTAGTWVVRGASGTLFRVQIVTFYANPDGSMGAAGGRYVLKVAPLS
jgi:hypothetical protein